METFLLISDTILAVLIVIAVLLQKSSSLGLGAYSTNESFFGAKGMGSFMTKLTFSLGALFILNTLALFYYYNHQPQESIIEKRIK